MAVREVTKAMQAKPSTNPIDEKELSKSGSFSTAAFAGGFCVGGKWRERARRRMVTQQRYCAVLCSDTSNQIRDIFNVQMPFNTMI